MFGVISIYVGNKREVKWQHLSGIEHKVSGWSHHNGIIQTTGQPAAVAFLFICLKTKKVIDVFLFVCLFVCLFVFCFVFQLRLVWVLYIFVLYCSWHTIPKYFCRWNMLYLPMRVKCTSVWIANAGALFHEYGDTLVVWYLIKKHNQLSGLLYEVKTSLYAGTGCNWKGSFTGEEVQHDPDQQRCSVSGSLALCWW